MAVKQKVGHICEASGATIKCWTAVLEIEGNDLKGFEKKHPVGGSFGHVAIGLRTGSKESIPPLKNILFLDPELEKEILRE